VSADDFVRSVKGAIDLGYRPRRWQQECHRRLKRFSVLVVHRRAGKTVMAIMTLLDAALRTHKTHARFGYIAPFRNQAKSIAWDYLTFYARKVPGVLVNESELWVEFPNGARVRLFGADNPDALRGLYFDGVVLDEVAQMRPTVWSTIVRPALTDRLGWALFIGTPQGVNLFSDLYFKGRRTPDRWYTALWRWQDTQVLSDEEVEDAAATMTEAAFRQEMECDFAAASENAVIAFDLVTRARKRHLRVDAYRDMPLIFGVDVARSETGDRTVIFPRRGLVAFEPFVCRGWDNMRVADKVVSMWQEMQPDAVFIDNGEGHGVVSRVKQLGFPAIGIDFGGKPVNPYYLHKREEMWDGVAEGLREGLVLPDMNDLQQDLCTPTYRHTRSKGQMQMESKDDLKARGLPSPDLGDGLALTYAMAVAARQDRYRDRGPSGREDRVETDYDPFTGGAT
jgi:hypothetical protein